MSYCRSGAARKGNRAARKRPAAAAPTESAEDNATDGASADDAPAVASHKYQTEDAACEQNDLRLVFKQG